MKKLLIIIPILLLILTACAKKNENESPIAENTKSDYLLLNKAILNQYFNQKIEFNKEFTLSGSLPQGLHIMPVLEEDNTLEIYGVAKEFGVFEFSLANLEEEKRYSLEVIEECLSFFDGCNYCTLDYPGDKAPMCTELYCEVYLASYCLD